MSLTFTALIGAAAVDSINPCTLAILIMLLSTLLTINKKNKVLLAGFVFSGVIFISYFLMGLGLYHAISNSSLVKTFYIIVILLAYLIGILSIKDYFFYKPGVWAVEIPLSWRPRLKKLIAKVTSVTGAGIIGFLCSLFLIPCSSGPYLLILGLLAKESTRISAIPLLLLYNFIFILPMLIITLLIYYAFLELETVQEWREKNIKKVHLISGIIMLILATLLLIYSF